MLQYNITNNKGSSMKYSNFDTLATIFTLSIAFIYVCYCSVQSYNLITIYFNL